MDQIFINLANSMSGDGERQSYGVNTGTTVAQLLSNLGLTPSNVNVRVNGNNVSGNTVLVGGENVTISQANVKGAHRS